MKKKIGVKTFVEATSAIGADTKIISLETHEEPINITVNTKLSVSDVADISRTVLALCCNEETGEYAPFVREIAEVYFVADNITDIKFPKDITKAYELIYNSGLYEVIIDSPIFKWVDTIVSRHIDYFKQIHANQVNNNAAKLISQFEQISNILAGAFDGITPESINALASKISDFDEEKLARAILSVKQEPETK